jgi:hypothetical protein
MVIKITICTFPSDSCFQETAGLEEELNFVYLIPISNEECRLTYGNQIKDSMVCVGGNFNEGFCQV